MLKDDGNLMSIPWLQKGILWLLFFLICMGLGYPTLNRYDPGKVDSLFDPGAYAALVTGSPLLEEQRDLSHRVLVPYLAKPVYAVAKGHLGTWNPAYFSLLVVNSFFIASTAWLLVEIGHVLVGQYTVALLAAFVYLANFMVANRRLSGYVDSAIDFVLIAIVWSLLAERWWMLAVWGALGALAKETFIPLSVVFASAWYLTGANAGSRKFSRPAWVGLMAAVGFGVLILVMSHQSPPYSPLSFATSRQAESGSHFLYLSGLIRCLTSHEFVFTFAWLLPLGLPSLRMLPRTWKAGAFGAGLTALALGAYDDALGNAVRPMFSALGPLLSLSTAILLAGKKVENYGR